METENSAADDCSRSQAHLHEQDVGVGARDLPELRVQAATCVAPRCKVVHDHEAVLAEGPPHLVLEDRHGVGENHVGWSADLPPEVDADNGELRVRLVQRLHAGQAATPGGGRSDVAHHTQSEAASSARAALLAAFLRSRCREARASLLSRLDDFLHFLRRRRAGADPDRIHTKQQLRNRLADTVRAGSGAPLLGCCSSGKRVGVP